MIKYLMAIMAAVLLAGCAGLEEYSKAVEQMDQRMSADWLHANVVAGKTTKDQIISWYGKPFSDTSMSSTSFGSAFMPDEMMVYSIRFSKPAGSGLGSYTEHWVKAVTFSIKNGTVSDYTVTKNSF